MQLDYNETLKLIEKRYEYVKNEAFDEQFVDFIEQKRKEDVTFTIENVQEFLDNFTFPEKYEWCLNEYNAYTGVLEDEHIE